MNAAYMPIHTITTLDHLNWCKQAAEDIENVEELRSRIRELETEQRLIQRELDSVTESAQRAESQLRWISRCAFSFIVDEWEDVQREPETQVLWNFSMQLQQTNCFYRSAFLSV